jgi:hypothetical protein
MHCPRQGSEGQTPPLMIFWTGAAVGAAREGMDETHRQLISVIERRGAQQRSVLGGDPGLRIFELGKREYPHLGRHQESDSLDEAAVGVIVCDHRDPLP